MVTEKPHREDHAEAQKSSEKHDAGDKSSSRMQGAVDRDSRHDFNERSKNEQKPENRLSKKTAGRAFFGECNIADVKTCGKHNNVEVQLKNGLPEKIQTQDQNWDRDAKNPKLWHVEKGNQNFDLKAEVKFDGKDVSAKVKYENGREVNYKNGEPSEIKHPNGEKWTADSKHPGTWDVVSPNKEDPSHPHHMQIHDVKVNVASGDITWKASNAAGEASHREIDSRGQYKEQSENHEKHSHSTRAAEAPVNNVIRLESSCRPGVVSESIPVNKPMDKADLATLTNFENTNCHASTMRKMGLNPEAGASTMMNNGVMEANGYKRVPISSVDELRPGDVVATPIEQKVGPLGWMKSSPDIAFGHSGFVEKDPVSGKLMITEKVGAGKDPYVRESPDKFAGTWTPEGGFAKNPDIFVYRKEVGDQNQSQHKQPADRSSVQEYKMRFSPADSHAAPKLGEHWHRLETAAGKPETHAAPKLEQAPHKIESHPLLNRLESTKESAHKAAENVNFARAEEHAKMVASQHFGNSMRIPPLNEVQHERHGSLRGALLNRLQQHSESSLPQSNMETTARPHMETRPQIAMPASVVGANVADSQIRGVNQEQPVDGGNWGRIAGNAWNAFTSGHKSYARESEQGQHNYIRTYNGEALPAAYLKTPSRQLGRSYSGGSGNFRSYMRSNS